MCCRRPRLPTPAHNHGRQDINVIFKPATATENHAIARQDYDKTPGKNEPNSFVFM